VGPSEDQQPREIGDPKAWRAYAHPVRIKLMAAIQERSAARVVDLAEAVGVPANKVSFHLRQLARYGFVEPDDTDHGDARERWWRTTSRTGFRMVAEEMMQSPEGEAAFRTVTAVYRDQSLAKVNAWHRLVNSDYDGGGRKPVVTNFDTTVDLAAEELEQFREELAAVLHKWHQHGLDRRAAGEEEGREPFELFCIGAYAADLRWAASDEGGRAPQR
jgi:DNA-binding MarR family transcriptional regulator